MQGVVLALLLCQRSLHGQQTLRQFHLQPFGFDIYFPEVSPNEGNQQFVTGRGTYDQHCRTGPFRLYIGDLAGYLGAPAAHVDHTHADQIADVDSIAVERNAFFAGSDQVKAAEVLRIGDRIDQ